MSTSDDKIKELMKALNGEFKKKPRLTIDDYMRALELCQGYKSQAAKILGVSPSAISKRIIRNKKLQAFVKDLLQDRDLRQIEIAEGKLLEAAGEGKPWAIKYILDNKGKERGFYGPKMKVDLDTGNQDPLAKYKEMPDEQRRRRIAELAGRLHKDEA